MNRQGFTLIEVLVALAITGFMATVLFTSLYQINKSVSVTDSFMTVYEKAARLQQLFEHDLTGATLLIDNDPPSKPEQETNVQQETDKKEPKGKKEPEEKQPTKKDKKIIKKIFYSTDNGNTLGTLSFVSNNPLLGFWSGQEGSFQAGKAKPFLVRITYTLQEDAARPGSFMLMRQESVPLDFEQRTGKSYEVMSGIKNIAFKYTLKTIKTSQEEPKKEVQKPEEQKKGQTQQPAKIQPPKEEIVLTSNISTWNSDEIIEENAKQEKTKEKSKDKKAPIPIYIDIEATLWDETYEHEYTYVYTIEIIADTEFVSRRQWSFMSWLQQDQKKDTEKKDQKTTPQPTPKTAIPAPQGQKVSLTPWDNNAELQKKLQDLFKTVQTLDKGRIT